MEVLWRNAPLAADAIAAQLHDQDWTEKTVKTFLNRLTKKEAITFEKRGRKYFYSPNMTRESFLLDESKGFVNTVFLGDIKKLLATFVKTDHISTAELDYLRELLEDDGANNK